MSCSAKHLDFPEEQLHNVAGSFGYVAPEVLSEKGHGRPVDIWSTGYVFSTPKSASTKYPFSIITYVLLCGYSPFRSENPKDLVQETINARIQFHDRYWKNVSAEAKDFILTLLKPNPAERPTATEALNLPWLRTKASTEHDLSGLRENFSPRAKWKNAIDAVRAAGRLNALAAQSRQNSELGRESTKTSDSGEWGGSVGDSRSPTGVGISRTTSDEEEEGDEGLEVKGFGRGNRTGSSPLASPPIQAEEDGEGGHGSSPIPHERKVAGHSIHEGHAHAIPDHAGEIESSKTGKELVGDKPSKDQQHEDDDDGFRIPGAFIWDKVKQALP